MRSGPVKAGIVRQRSCIKVHHNGQKVRSSMPVSFCVASPAATGAKFYLRRWEGLSMEPEEVTGKPDAFVQQPPDETAKVSSIPGAGNTTAHFRTVPRANFCASSLMAFSIAAPAGVSKLSALKTRYSVYIDEAGRCALALNTSTAPSSKRTL